MVVKVERKQMLKNGCVPKLVLSLIQVILQNTKEQGKLIQLKEKEYHKDT